MINVETFLNKYYLSFFLVCETCIGGNSGKEESDIKTCGVCNNRQALVEKLMNNNRNVKERTNTTDKPEMQKEQGTEEENKETENPNACGDKCSQTSEKLCGKCVSDYAEKMACE